LSQANGTTLNRWLALFRGINVGGNRTQLSHSRKADGFGVRSVNDSMNAITAIWEAGHYRTPPEK
jgi:hypothetical protein